MTLLARVKIDLQGWPGAPGCNVLHFSEGTAGGSGWDQSRVEDLLTEVDSLVESLKSSWAPGVKMRVLPDVAVFDVATGQIQDVKVSTIGTSEIVATGTKGTLGRGQAACVRFVGDRFLNGRRLNGRMYLGPLAGDSIGADGLIGGAVQDAIAGNFTAITSGLGTRLAIWHRPTSKLANDGTWADVAQVSVNPTPSNLRSRSY